MNRRNGPDALVNWLKYSNLVIWALILIFLSFADLAKPEQKTLFDHLFSIERPDIWDTRQLVYALIVVIILLTLSIVTLVINIMRNKRKTDYIHKSVIFSLLLSIFSTVLIVKKIFY